MTKLQKGIQIHYITLHVGLGTFRPVMVDNIEDHVMHSEFYKMSKETAEKLSRAKEEEEIQNLLSQIREVLDSLSDDASVGAERDWLQKVNIQTISLSEVLKHYDVALFLKKKSEDRAKRAQLIDELRAEYMDNGYVKEPTKVDSSSAINDMRSEWGN